MGLKTFHVLVQAGVLLLVVFFGLASAYDISRKKAFGNIYVFEECQFANDVYRELYPNPEDAPLVDWDDGLGRNEVRILLWTEHIEIMPF